MSRVWGFLVTVWVSTLLGCGLVESGTSREAGVRVGNAHFSVASPPGEGWTLHSRETSITFQHADRSWFQEVGKTRITVSLQPISRSPRPRSEGALAREVLAATKESYSRLEPATATSNIAETEIQAQGRHFYGFRYQAWTCRPSEDPAWGDDIAEVQAEFYIHFPLGSHSATYYSFEIFVSRSLGWASDGENLRQIDAVLRSFQEKTIPEYTSPGTDLRAVP